MGHLLMACLLLIHHAGGPKIDLMCVSSVMEKMGCGPCGGAYEFKRTKQPI